MNCRICDNDKNLTKYEVREMMLGLREVFSYFQCPVCGCLQITEVPPDMTKYYPPDYYSFSAYKFNTKGFRSQLIRMRDSFAVFNLGFLGRIFYRLFPDEVLKLYSGTPVQYHILDVGCGSGRLIYRLREIGFKNIMGIDPLNNESITYSNGLKVEKKTLGETGGKWDLITYHHSFEHIALPLEELRRVSEMLTDNGLCIIRLPVVDSYAWEQYETNWVQIDAPRHYFLYSIKSFSMLVEKTDLEISKIEYDSTAFQFWGSEQYERNIPLLGKGSYSINPGRSAFTRGEIRKFEHMAKELNNSRKGDQAIFFVKKKDQSEQG